MPKKLTFTLLTLFVIALLSTPFLLDQIEKHTLKPPPPYKTLKELKGLDKVEISTVSGKIKYPHDYTILLIGDSMTEYLGNSDELRGYLNEYYPTKAIEVLNYSYGATNILSVPERLEKTTQYKREYRPILDIDFDLIVIESMGHNPLSEFPLEEGLKKQTETLDYIVGKVKEQNPDAKILFLATLGLNNDYAKEIVNLTADTKKIWLNERRSYILNHIKYAEDHQIPVADAYHKSLDMFGNAKSFYISQYDHLHPSAKGVLLISKTLANKIHELNLIPN